MHFPIKLYGGHIPVNQILVFSILTFTAVIILRMLTEIFPELYAIFSYLNFLIKRDVIHELEEQILVPQIIVPYNKTI
jgi:hypothetical protein